MLRIFLIAVVLLVFQVPPSLLMAYDHKTVNRSNRQHETRNERHDYEDHKGGRVEKDAKGHEVTGQVAAWLLVSANLTVFFSIITKGLNRFLPLSPHRKHTIKAFNQFQKKYLIRFHYVLNPIALCVAFLHFLLSSCRSSPLPEWGLVVVTVMVVLGLMVKFGASPKSMRKGVYRFHTSSAAFSAVILALVVGHLMVD
jgi:hypothetical protein